MSTRLALPARRNHITQNVKIAGQRTLYLTVHDDKYPTEIFLWQDVGPLIQSPQEPPTQSTQGEPSPANSEEEA